MQWTDIETQFSTDPHRHYIVRVEYENVRMLYMCILTTRADRFDKYALTGFSGMGRRFVYWQRTPEEKTDMQMDLFGNQPERRVLWAPLEE